MPLLLAVGEGDAVGEGLAAGLGFAAAAFSVAPMGEADGEGLTVFGDVELLAGSQAAANRIESIARRGSAVRLMIFVFEVSISFLPRFTNIEKRGYSCPCVN